MGHKIDDQTSSSAEKKKYLHQKNSGKWPFEIIILPGQTHLRHWPHDIDCSTFQPTTWQTPLRSCSVLYIHLPVAVLGDLRASKRVAPTYLPSCRMTMRVVAHGNHSYSCWRSQGVVVSSYHTILARYVVNDCFCSRAFFDFEFPL